ncbi:MAG: hypothetical protein IPK13_24110 [Deltaproteobacteria bacterium]|nr:hypothetical protein [Deltaproteobacteria bacterium]
MRTSSLRRRALTHLALGTFVVSGACGSPDAGRVWATHEDAVTSRPPLGQHDGVMNTGGTTWRTWGWAFDPDEPSASLWVHIYADAPAGQGGQFLAAVMADVPRPDVNEVYGIEGAHGFDWIIPASLIQDGREHALYAYAIDPRGGENPALGATPRWLATTRGPPLGSTYGELQEDVPISSSTVLLSSAIDLDRRQTVLVASDGRFFPMGPSYARMFIRVDGTQVSNDGAIDWRGSLGPVQHAYNLIGGATLDAGRHVVELVAENSLGKSGFVVGRASNLSVMVQPAREIAVAQTAQDSDVFNFNTKYLTAGAPAPHTPILSHIIDVAADEPVVALASTNAYAAGSYGDAMMGIYVDGTHAGNAQSQWSVTDLWKGAELRSPMFSHAYFTTLRAGQRTFSFDASEFPWGGYANWTEDSVVYRVGARTQFVVLRGGFRVSGSAPTAWAIDDWWARIGIGSNTGNAPNADEPVLLAEGRFTIPADHNGTVMFLGKTRVQGDGGNEAIGRFHASLFLHIDGTHRGSVGVQGFAEGQSISQRSISASYLATNQDALAPGDHVVQLYGQIATLGAKVPWSFMHKDLNLIWFD